ncbi:MAG: hypothetical protein PUC68_08070, partial [Firmicutes bacterium]|nr:hypothetical protein [Bacillota bacterium]
MNNIGFFKYINGFLIDDATRKIISSNDFERFLLMNDNTIFLKNIKAGISDETKIYAGNVCLKIRVKTFDNEICGVIEESSETASNFIGYWQMEKDAVEGERVLAKYLGYDDIKINDVVVHSSFETEFKEDEFELKVISKNKEFKWILFKKEDDIGMMFDNTSTHELSYVDTITGGLNREGFLNRVEELFYAENEMDYSILY